MILSKKLDLKNLNNNKFKEMPNNLKLLICNHSSINSDVMPKELV